MESMEIEVRVPILLQKLRDLLAHERNVYSRSTALVRMTATKSVLESICKKIGGLERGHASQDIVQLRKDGFLSMLNEIEHVIDKFIAKTELRRRNRFIEIMPPLIYLASLPDQIRLKSKMDELTTYAEGRLPKVGIGESTTTTNPRTTHAEGPLSEEEIPEPTNATDLPATESKTVPYLHTTTAKASLSEEEIVESTTATNLHTTYAEGRSSEEEITETTATELHALESKTVPDLHTTNAKGRLYEEEIMESTITTNPHATHAKGQTTIEEIMKPGDSDFVGLEDKRDELLEKLFYSKGQESDNVIAVTGNAGSGKTVLTKTIYNAPYVRRAFNDRAWVNVSEDFEAREILLNILRQLRWESKYENLPDNVLEQRLESFLKEKRCLVVVDDVRTPFDMEKLSVVLKCIGGWSRLILTTRDINVACAANPRRNPIMLRSLTDEESWALFLKKAQIAEGNLNNRALKKEILKKCGGSPLQIIILGRLLSKKNLNEWSNVIKQLRNTNLSKSSTMIKDEHRQLSIRESSSVTEPAVQQSSTAGLRKSSSVIEPAVKQLSTADVTDSSSATEPAVQQLPTADVTDSSSATEPAVQQLPTADVTDSSSATEPAGQESIYTLSYQELSPRTQFCFLYFGLFPRAFEIPVRRLFHLWLAEGLLIPLPEEQKAPEDLAEEYFEQLLSRGLIEVADERADERLDGSPKRYCMPGDIWDEFNPKAVGPRLFYDIRRTHESENSPNYDIRTTHESKNSPKIRRLVENAYSKNSSSDSCSKYYSPLYIQNLRCYVSFDTRKRDLPIQEVRMFLKTIVTERGFGLLVVLDLENVYKPMLSETLGKLLHLKYLGLRWTFLDSLPTSVGNLPYLETLDVKHTNIFALPSSIWKAKNLRHLYLSEIHIDMSVKKPNCQSLTNLKTLWGLSIGNESLVKNCLSELTGLRKLKLTCISESEFEAKWIKKLSNLESLKLRSIDAFGKPSALNLETVAALDKLRDLYLLGQLPRAIDNDQFPSKLTILTLSASRREEDPMQILGQLPELNILRLLRDSYTGKQMICKGFPKLSVLKLWMLDRLEEWIVENGAMPRLRKLEIRCCNQLKQTVGLELMKDLEKVTLTDMPDGFAEKVMVNANVEKVTQSFAP